MGLTKQRLLQEYEEEMGNSNLSWSQVKAVLKHLMQEFPNTVTWRVQNAIEKREGNGPCGIDWSSIRQMMNNLADIYFSDLSLNDLYGQIAHMGDQYDSLGGKADSAREHSDF